MDGRMDGWMDGWMDEWMDGGVRWAYYECELGVSAALVWYVQT